jgi:starch-binding outer membrane protein, SusD/RagB family
MKNNYFMKSRMCLFGVFVTLFTFSCTNLDEKIYSSVTADNFFKTPEEQATALAAAYTNLLGIGNHNSMWSDNEVSTDELMIPVKGQDWLDNNQWVRMHRHQYIATEESLNNMWSFCFAGVNICNRLVAQFEAIPGTTAAIAELKCLRALYYFWLMDNFGGVPLVTALVGAEANPTRATRAAIYSFIVSELTTNIPNLSDKADVSTYGRMNKFGANALLAKVYLNSGVYSGGGTPASADLDKAIAACDVIINSGKYGLESTYLNIFGPTNDQSKEHIFAVPYDEKFAQGFNFGQMTLHYESQKTYNLQAQPWNGYTSLKEFYDSYDVADDRKKSFLVGPQFTSGGVPLTDTGAEPNDPDGPALNFTPAVNELTPNAFRQAGARIGKFAYKLGATPNLDNDFPIFRYGEVLLMKAEALWRKNNGDAAALALVNQLRTRAKAPALASLGTPADAYPGPELLKEYGRECFAEGKRRNDLIRFGKYSELWFGKTATSAASKTIFPIPQPQIVANPSLTQNPGY